MAEHLRAECHRVTEYQRSARVSRTPARRDRHAQREQCGAGLRPARLAGKQVVKAITVPDKLVNVVVKQAATCDN